MLSILDMVKSVSSEKPAIGGLSRQALSYGKLAALAACTVREINEMGIGRRDRVALVLRNGPGMATAFIALSAGVSVAPLNPTYRVDEFELYFSDLQVKAIIVEKDVASAATVAAARLHIPVVEIDCDMDEPAGWFQFHGARQICDGAAEYGYAGPGDEALALHTSGTTSRPKIVSLSHSNLANSARNVGATLRLAPGDVGLNMMPLFHIHGLVGSLLVSMTAGSQVVCAPAFDPLQVYRWFQEAEPTWYTAVPTMHQTILARAPHNEAVIQTMRLRFIRSSSAALPPQIATSLEQLFKCPVIEAYGMTEASHQIACNPLPPEIRKVGTVGRPAGPEVAIVDEHQGLIGQSQIGEIVIRGPNVFAGYDNNPDANLSAFTDGWFRTGDQGFIDADGYITITGRLKEIIIRGGEKIAPREIDEALQAHPAVGQAVAFALPHPKLGEEVAAIIVLREGMTANEHEIREFVAARLAKFKVPRRIYFRDQIPKTATGKIQRISLANTLGLVREEYVMTDIATVVRTDRVERRCSSLRSMLQAEDLTFLMEAHNGLSARIAQEAGFKALWASGLSISASLGVRDRNEAAWTQILEVVEFMADSASVPILMDGDTGFGDFNNVRRLVRKLCQRHVAGICLEDKMFPKTNSFLGDGQELVSIEEFCGKIRAAKDAQYDDDFCVVARIEALIAGRGMSEALKRGEAYHAAGADAILIHSKKKSPDEVLEFTRLWDKRSPVIIVPTMYYNTPTDQFRKAGVSAVIWANHSLRASIYAMQSVVNRIVSNQSVAEIDGDIASIEEVFRLTDVAELEMAEKLYTQSPDVGANR